MQIGELWVKIGGRDDALKSTLSGVEGRLRGVGENLSSLGSDLTKKITLPVVGATAAVGGLVASFGWGRLKAMDAAEAQLKGLGYAVEDVARISEQVKNAVQGTTMTMAEGTSVAAGALAAGVKEGAELEKYIKQVGNAAVGANRPIADMAQIFNRIQGSGRLMTQELNMIEDGMPGFAMAMSDALGVTQAEFRKMVTEGKVSSEQFLTVMDTFAGEMSEAYANSWAGMVSNTKAWIGIIGESLMSGVFEQSKESIAEFMELLKSDDVQKWAAETGQKIGEAFSNIIEKIKGAIEWWTSLDSSTQKLIGTAALFFAAIGPVLMVLGSLASALSAIISIAPVVGAAFTIMTGPIGLVIAAIVALGAAIYLIYKQWKENGEKSKELLRNFADYLKNTWDAIKRNTLEVWTTIKDWLYNLWEGIKSQVVKAWDSIYKTLTNTWDMIKTGFSNLVDSAKNWGRNLIQNLIDGIKERFEALRNIVSDMADMVSGYLGFSSPTKLGPGRYADKWAPNLVNMFADGIKNSMPALQVSLADMAAVMPGVFGSVVNNTSNSSTSNISTSNNYFSINVPGGNSREQAEGIMRELHRLGVRF